MTHPPHLSLGLDPTGHLVAQFPELAAFLDRKPRRRIAHLALTAPWAAHLRRLSQDPTLTMRSGVPARCQYLRFLRSEMGGWSCYPSRFIVMAHYLVQIRERQSRRAMIQSRGPWAAMAL